MDKLTLFIELNESSFIFTIGEYDNDYNFKILEKINSENKVFSQNKLTDIEEAKKLIKINIQTIEQKHNFIFKEVIVILDSFSYSCINVSDFKKLNGSQILKDNISYILNSLKLSITENERDKSILHIFNTKSILDGVAMENLPIGLFGDFYSHELSFFLISRNDIKNIKKIFIQNNLNVKKFIIKDFVNGVQRINENKGNNTFFEIKISKNKSKIVFFDHSAMKYIENFNFGSDILYKDISKICSISNEIIKKILNDKVFNIQNFKKDEFLENKFFIKTNYRKIRKELILEIVNARIEELASLILNNNSNLGAINKKNCNIYLNIEDHLIKENFSSNFKFLFSDKINSNVNLISRFDKEETVKNAANLSIFGWRKEAIPITQTKNSIITRIFKSIFS